MSKPPVQAVGAVTRKFWRAFRKQLRASRSNGTLENAQAMAAHESPRTTKLYDSTAGLEAVAGAIPQSGVLD
jgi:hypothetical protein